MFKFGNKDYKSPAEKIKYENYMNEVNQIEEQRDLEQFYGIDQSNNNEYIDNLEDMDINENVDHYDDNSSSSSDNTNSSNQNDYEENNESEDISYNNSEYLTKIENEINKLQNIHKNISKKIKSNKFKNGKYKHTVESYMDENGELQVYIKESKLQNDNNQSGGGCHTKQCNHWSDDGQRCVNHNLETYASDSKYNHYCEDHANDKKEFMNTMMDILDVPEDNITILNLKNGITNNTKKNIHIPLDIIDDLMNELVFLMLKDQIKLIEMDTADNQKSAKKKQSSPKKKKSSPKKKQSSPKKKQSSPKKKQSSAKKKQSSPNKKQSSPRKKKSSPRKKKSSPNTDKQK